MNKKTVFSILLTILISILITSVSAYGYYDDEFPWYETGSYDIHSYYSNPSEPNQVIIEFDKNGSYEVYTPDNSFYKNMIIGIDRCMFDQIRDDDANATTLKNEVKEVCKYWGIENPEIKITSPYGEDTFIYIAQADGISMEPTIQNGEVLVINKTRDIHVGDIVPAYYPTYTNLYILKRVSIIDGDDVYLTSDNVEGSYVVNGKLYDYKGLCAWVKKSDIQGVLIDHYFDDKYNYTEHNPDLFEL